MTGDSRIVTKGDGWYSYYHYRFHESELTYMKPPALRAGMLMLAGPTFNLIITATFETNTGTVQNWIVKTCSETYQLWYDCYCIILTYSIPHSNNLNQ